LRCVTPNPSLMARKDFTEETIILKALCESVISGWADGIRRGYFQQTLINDQRKCEEFGQKLHEKIVVKVPNDKRTD